MLGYQVPEESVFMVVSVAAVFFLRESSSTHIDNGERIHPTSPIPGINPDESRTGSVCLHLHLSLYLVHSGFCAADAVGVYFPAPDLFEYPAMDCHGRWRRNHSWKQ